MRYKRSGSTTTVFHLLPNQYENYGPTGRYTALFALFGCLPALFVFGLFFLVVVFEEWSFRTKRDHLADVHVVIFMTGFVVGHWWQGRLVEGVGLMALFFGGFWLADAQK